jgi:hypothetical protein
MNQIASNFVDTLSMGKWEKESGELEGNDPVRVLAKVYEVARNALEYRADHLVRRAAIERIVKRQVVFEQDDQKVAETLLQELKWARYVADPKSESATVADISEIISKYRPFFSSNSIDKTWLMGLVSAEIEERLNPNTDYHKFTTFAFHIIKSKVKLENIDNLDLLLFVAVDKVYSQSDDQQVSYHLLKLIRNQTRNAENWNNEKLIQETYRYFQLAKNSRVTNRLSVFVRKQIGPLVLIRDVYFFNAEKFTELLKDENLFRQAETEILTEQLHHMRGRLNRATVRSLIYVFLTKMLLILVVEIPVEKFLRGSGSLVTLLANITFPVIIMWILTSRIRLPGKREQETVKNAAVGIVFKDSIEAPEGQILISLDQKGSQIMVILYYIFYGILFLAIFAGLIYLLSWLKFSIISQVIFLFFLCLVTFFAFRIKQTAMVYNYQPKVRTGYSFSENLMLPIVTVGGLLSQGVSRLNFLVFIFDFVLEAPFKIILHFLDKWFAFLSVKKDEIVG